MPKQVDPDARRADVVDALFRVALREGLPRVSLRTVAAEAELNIGSLRHYFASQPELMRFAMSAMLDRVAARLMRRVAAAAEAGDDPEALRARAVEMFGELLPLDDARRAELMIFLDFSAAARTDPDLADLARTAARGARALVRRVLGRLARAGAIRSDVDLDLETERLTALLDGLGVNAALHPDLVDADTCLAVVRTHLRHLAPPP
ncbi:TetR family transcriptional regulator [Virgisporangium aliadipatigenens]|uniref:TetR family transcriptional regulator n=1 Tax=Virgisporangium aliadipatigenens TaxID=741659 RepID=A0A8J3YHY4_9ACTN|nr:TetR family transcriptional regulator C-terminal domain-containing protein [Virgisporangium aliadipatigenens]GIJ44345.1 TetR family transcriptional regulator [Virgisporangium aliadipatigenens]